MLGSVLGSVLMALRLLAAAVGVLALAEAQHTFNSCADHSSIGRNECVGQGDSCRWCGDYVRAPNASLCLCC